MDFNFTIALFQGLVGLASGIGLIVASNRMYNKKSSDGYFSFSGACLALYAILSFLFQLAVHGL